MNKKPLLTVAIPTYERPKPLEKILQQLGSQTNQNFQILISDDSASKNIEQVVNRYKRRLPNLHYNRNTKNLGFSGNVCKLYELAQTRYIWFLCDDDTVLPNAIDNILRALNAYQPVVAVFNTQWIDSYGRDRIAGVTKNTLYTDIKKLNDYQPLMRTTFLSIVVVEKRKSVEALKKEAYKDNIFFQVTLAMFLLSDKFIYCEIASPIVRRNVGYKYGEFFKFILVDSLKAVFLIQHKFEKKKFVDWSKKQLFTSFQLYLSQKIGLFKYNGSPTKNTIKMLREYFGFYILFIALFKPIYILFPKFILKNIYFAQLVQIHGLSKARKVYKANIDRAYTDERKTGFTTYR